jgi:hypothetical protein
MCVLVMDALYALLMNGSTSSTSCCLDLVRVKERRSEGQRGGGALGWVRWCEEWCWPRNGLSGAMVFSNGLLGALIPASLLYPGLTVEAYLWGVGGLTRGGDTPGPSLSSRTDGESTKLIKQMLQGDLAVNGTKGGGCPKATHPLTQRLASCCQSSLNPRCHSLAHSHSMRLVVASCLRADVKRGRHAFVRESCTVLCLPSPIRSTVVPQSMHKYTHTRTRARTHTHTP